MSEGEFNVIEDKEAYHQFPKQTLESAFKDVCYGSVAGIVAKMVEHPLDLVKVRLQSQPLDQPLRFKGPLDCMMQTFKGEGVKALWRGVSMPMAGAMAENATLFVVYNQSQAVLRKLFPSPPTPLSEPAPLPLGQLTFSASLAGAAASFVLTPVELIKCKMQVQNIAASTSSASLATSSAATAAASSATLAIPLPPQQRQRQAGPFTIIRQILLRDGIKGLWLGQTGTIIRETGGSAAWFTTFEVLSRFFVERRVASGQTKPDGGRVTKSDLAAWELMLSGAAAGVTYNTILFPADAIKSTIQTMDELSGGKGERRSFVQTGKDIYRARGIRGLYSGCGLTAIRAAPSSALIFYIYSRMESYFG